MKRRLIFPEKITVNFKMSPATNLFSALRFDLEIRMLFHGTLACVVCGMYQGAKGLSPHRSTETNFRYEIWPLVVYCCLYIPDNRFSCCKTDATWTNSITRLIYHTARVCRGGFRIIIISEWIRFERVWSGSTVCHSANNLYTHS